MAKKNHFWLRILAILLVFGMTVLGCDNDDEEYSYTFVNNSSHVITISGADLNPSYFTIDPGETKTATSSKSPVGFTYSPEELVSGISSNGIVTFSDI